MNLRIAAIGECMLEVFDQGDGSARFAYGGDTLNTAIYLARLGLPIHYITALGDDPYSEQLVNAWQKEGVKTEHTLRIEGELPGLYTIRVNAQGERQFYYWRSQAPAKRMFSFPQSADLAEKISEFDWLYLSGITLMILNPSDRSILLRCLQAAKARGAKLAFDSNYRARGWSSAATAANEMRPFIELADVYLPGVDDLNALYGLTQPEQIFARFDYVPELLLKDGQRGCYLRQGGTMHHIEAVKVDRVVDSTAAGDSFNAAYLAQRWLGEDAIEAAGFAAELAAVVVQNRGAIIDRIPMSRFLGALRHKAQR